MSRSGESSRASFNTFGLAHGVRKVSNQLAFLAHTSPAVPLHRDFATGQRYFFLDDLWTAFDEPSAFGCEIPLELQSDDGVCSAVTQCYVPYLSALQLFDCDRRCLHTRCCDDGSDEETSQESASSDAQSISSSSTGSDEEKFGSSTFRLGSRLPPPGARRRPLFEFQETAIPHMREPLTDRVHRLGMPSGLRSCDLHPHSWRAAGAHAVPDALTFLTPFGFLAHKAKGRTNASEVLWTELSSFGISRQPSSARRLAVQRQNGDRDAVVMGATEQAEFDGDFVAKHGWGTHQDTADDCKSAYAGSNWLSGAKYRLADIDAATARVAAVKAAEAQRLIALRSNASMPLVFLDVAIQGRKVGRMEFVLFSHEAPRSAENFRALCTGEKGVVPAGREGAGKPYHFKDAFFYRIIDQFIDQSGANTESVFGGQFKDDEEGLKLKHDRRGLLSMANMGPDTNTSHFSILMAPAPHLDTHYTIFGELVSGWEVAEQINALSRGRPDNTATADAGAQIVNSGQVQR
ncbi:hypothetical protein WJX73_006168 [Symbiochloris irregularis]|uniref:PPIase cyclophilin-type domain-containing protein n=1 Tax=Symbiochloris irregularis TaxID=706552 RepID=A0AAW1P056_9CHLO